MLAPRIAIEGDALIPHPYSHVGIRRKHSQCQRARFIEYPVSALDQFGARIVACKKKGCCELVAVVRKFVENSNSCSAIAPSSL